LAFAKEWLQQKFSAAVPPEVAVSYYSFDQTLAPLASLDSITTTGSLTALADALEGLLSVRSDDPLTGVVLCSDGIENVTRQPEAVARLFRQKGIPIHVVCAGTTNDVRDILIENVQVKRAVPNKAPTRIAITLRSSGFSNQRVPIEVRNDQKVVAQYADEVDVEPGTVLAQEGKLAYEFFAIKAGTAEVKLGGQHAAELGPGDFFGEIGLLAGDRRVASVVASSPMSLVVLTGAQLRAIDSRMPGVAERIRGAMAQRIAANRVASG